MEKKDHHGKKRWREKVWGIAHVYTGCMCAGWSAMVSTAGLQGEQSSLFTIPRRKNKNKKQQNQRAAPAQTVKNQTLQNRRQMQNLLMGSGR